MLVAFLLLLAIGLIVYGHWRFFKANPGEEVSSSHIWGYVILSVTIVMMSVVHFCTVGKVINLEAQYYTFYTYSQEVQDNVLIIDIAKLEGKMVPSGSSQVTDVVSIGKLRTDVLNYNYDLYGTRQWAKDPFIGWVMESPNKDLKPIILR